MKKRIAFHALAAALALTTGISACGGGGDAASGSAPPVVFVETPVQTGDGWQTASLADVGIATQPIVDGMIEGRRGTYNEIHGVVIVKDGLLVFEDYGHGSMYDPTMPGGFTPVIAFDRDEPHILHSVSKSFMSTLVGIAAREHYLAGKSQALLDWFPEHFDPDQPEKGDIQLQHLMTMTSGLEWNEWDVPTMDFVNNDAMRYQRAADPSAYFFEKPLVHEPGSTFYYNTAGFQMLGEVIRRASAMSLDQFAAQFLFTPLGIADWRWPQYAHGPVNIVGDILLRPRDMAKFGQLVLDRGMWNGQQVVPAEWLDLATAEHVSVAHTGYKGYSGYGFFWWRKVFHVAGQSVTAICADGLAGQSIMVFPALNLVVVVTSGNYDEPELEHLMIANHVLPAVLG